MVAGADQPDAHNDSVIALEDRAAWRAALASPRPVIAHLNADTTWLLQLPVPGSVTTSSRSRSKTKSKAPERSRFNILIDPWLQGPQSDVASWFSTQWHVVAPTVQNMQELDEVLVMLEEGDPLNDPNESKTPATSYIDCVVISHEFTDHCHQATLVELPKSVPVVATEKAADLIRSWAHFDTVITTPGFSASTPDWQQVLVDHTGALPPWLGIGRVITEGNALYYHSAVMIAFDLGYSPNQRATRSRDNAPQGQSEAIIYSPHGIKGSDLECLNTAGIKTLALLHGLHNVRIWMTAQLNLGALNGIQAVRASGARYWIATHDEAKRGGGFISWLLQRTTYSLRDVVEADKAKDTGDADGDSADYKFLELGSGDGLVLS
ncbi:hypothetical protein VMCG_03104 [Cytospora schulzeri]|uniref:Metallo-beta-lactamase domain-containing protein n=1 Tax=Cytospora schulzeri TaxID=448051 RepID=A0A423WY57_9PEZI|nr:hypothetical protein VMCG_03104 [Valsa malicola]